MLPPATRLSIAMPALPNATPFPLPALRNGSLASSNHPSSRLLKSPPASFSVVRLLATYPEGTPQSPTSLRPRWTNFLSSLLPFLPSKCDILGHCGDCVGLHAIAHEKICMVG